ncbi:ABC transporter substrate-binding protein [Pusillimonas caeni]|uniref:ABC transporter substrate-binding protein n=1 Tax=Pusillimonas caeni TaxID=1348472 RepID=UPI000E599AC0|nr:ABC transporter substrate-binding protein [Pusillimonas caeni]TFL14532.1 ABC transporter substrate-binding protein [Pusillimonas caeni]
MKIRHAFTIVAASLAFAALAMPFRAMAADTVKHVAIAGWGPHPTLTEVVDGVLHGLAEQGYSTEKGNLAIEESHVNFDRSLLPQMLTKLAGTRPDLMITVSTPPSQTAQILLRGRDFPIVFAPVGDPVQAGLVPSWDRGGKMATGASNMPDWDSMLNFMGTLLPKLQRIGVLYDTADDSSTSFLHAITPAAVKHGLEVVPIGMDSPAEIPQRMRSVAGKRIDALIPASSGRIYSSMAAIAAVAQSMGWPIIGTHGDPVEHGQALAALTVEWFKVGEAAGIMAGKVLKGSSTESLPPYRPGDADMHPVISQRLMEHYRIELPPSLAGCDCVVP